MQATAYIVKSCLSYLTAVLAPCMAHALDLASFKTLIRSNQAAAAPFLLQETTCTVFAAAELLLHKPE
jgi:hypothetical protein